MQDSWTTATDGERRALADIWNRVRTQSFAHQFAIERLEKQVAKEGRAQAWPNIGGLALLVIGNAMVLFGAEDGGSFGKYLKVAGTIVLVISTLLGLLSLYKSITSDRDRTIELIGIHRVMYGQFMALSNDTRQQIAGVFGAEYYKHLIHFLNESIGKIQAVGRPPSRGDYDLAHEMMSTLKAHSDPDVQSSFKPDELATNLPALETPRRGAVG